MTRRVAMIADPSPGFYVSVIDGPRYALVEGPFEVHADALARVDAAKAECVDPRGWFYAWGTARVHADGERRAVPRRRVRLPLFEPQPSEHRFSVYADAHGCLKWLPAGAPKLERGWTELAKVTLPRRMPQPEWDVLTATCEALVRVYGERL